MRRRMLRAPDTIAENRPGDAPWLTVVVPLYNEEESLRPLYTALTSTLGGGSYELLFVDDGSTDGSYQELRALQAEDANVRILHFARNFGKAEALAAGFRESRGEIIVTMDADLQDEPSQIPILVAALAEGHDLASGWKHPRRDPLSKTFPSRVFNAMAGLLTGVRFNDLNSGFKAYRRRVITDLQVYGEMHRFLPVLAHWKGFRVTEVPVVHHPRQYGRSKYGPARFLSGTLDLLTVLYLTRFQQKPLHLFGSMGLICLTVGGLINLYLTGLWLAGEPIGTRPLLQLGVLLMFTGVQFLSLGLLGEMVTLSTARGQQKVHVYEVIEPAADHDAPMATAPAASAAREAGRAPELYT